MKMIKVFGVCLFVLLMAFPVWGEARRRYGEPEKVEAFADALMQEEREYMIVHLLPHEFNDQLCPEEMAWIRKVEKHLRRRRKASRAEWLWKDLIISRVLEPIQGQTPNCFFLFDANISYHDPMHPPYVPLSLDTEWVVILDRLLSLDRKTLNDEFPQKSADLAPFLGHDNLFQFYQKPRGILCLKESDWPRSPHEHIEDVYPESVVEDLKAIVEVMSVGGDTNALLALEGELEVEFSRKLVQEIVRRKQPPPPPTQEEIWREEIADFWRRVRAGEDELR